MAEAMCRRYPIVTTSTFTHEGPGSREGLGASWRSAERRICLPSTMAAFGLSQGASYASTISLQGTARVTPVSPGQRQTLYRRKQTPPTTIPSTWEVINR